VANVISCSLFAAPRRPSAVFALGLRVAGSQGASIDSWGEYIWSIYGIYLNQVEFEFIAVFSNGLVFYHVECGVIEDHHAADNATGVGWIE